MLKALRGLGATLVAPLLVVAWGGTASAGEGPGSGGTDTPAGYAAFVVTLTGDVSTSKKAAVAKPAPLCWWSPVAAPDPDDAEGVYEWFQALVSSMGPSSAGGGRETQASVPDYPQSFLDAIEADKEDPGVTWYRLNWREDLGGGVDAMKRLVDAGCTSGKVITYEGGVTLDLPIAYNYFPQGNPPEPRVDVRLLAQYAYDVMDLVEPTLNWNPRIGDQGGATLVNLPTWMWVRDADSVQTRTVTASVGGVSVTVTATTDGLSITSPAGSKQCTPAEAKYAWSAGRNESQACRVRFTRGSYGYPEGFPVAARTSWQASWTASTGESDILSPRLVGETQYVPVAQSQALVTEVD